MKNPRGHAARSAIRTPTGRSTRHSRSSHPNDSISYPDMLSGSLPKVHKPWYIISTACHSPRSAALRWCVWTLMAKDFKASALHVSELSIALPWIPKNSPQSWIALVIKWLTKNTKTYTIWLEMIARVLNMPIGLKGNNYYSKVFKRVNYKLWNNTFWVVIMNLGL